MAEALYVHIPFCQSICAYCDFCRAVYQSSLADRYLSVLEEECKQITESSFKTIYIGGGTPSSLSVKQLKRLFEILKPYSDKTIEYTIEMNPETVTEEKVKCLSDYHINRVSLGVQSFDSSLLEAMHRNHREKEVIDAIDLLHRYGICNISVDFIYGLPDQSMDQFVDSIKKAISLKIPHISLYGLTIEEHSYYGRNHIEALDSEQSDAMYFEAIRILEEAGYHQYEISNFALSGYQSKHNLVYWHYEDFVAVGLSAAGKINQQRYTNTDNFMEYFNHQYRKEVINLEKEDQLFEYVMMGLRLKEGIDLKSIYGKEVQIYYKEQIESLIQRNLLTIENHFLKATDKGFYILNDILIEFLD